MRMISLLWVCVLTFGFSFSMPGDGTVFAADKMSLNLCSDQKLGIKILCNPDWQLVTKQHNFTMIIEEDAQESVSVTIAKSDQKAGRLSELNRSVLQFLGGYEDFFKVESFKFGSRDALKVEGGLKESPDTQSLDYYLIHDGYLYMVLFSCHPKKHFVNYKKMFEEMIASFEFIE